MNYSTVSSVYQVNATKSEADMGLDKAGLGRLAAKVAKGHSDGTRGIMRHNLSRHSAFRTHFGGEI